MKDIWKFIKWIYVMLSTMIMWVSFKYNDFQNIKDGLQEDVPAMTTFFHSLVEKDSIIQLLLILVAIIFIMLMVKRTVKDEMNKNAEKINNINEVTSHVAIHAGITNRFTRDVLMPQVDQDQLITFLLDNHYKLSDIETYGFDREFQKIFYLKATERQIEWAKNLKIEKDENDKTK